MPRIINDETFEKVNAILKGRTHNAPYKKAKETYYLTGKIFCGVCGSSYTGTRHRCGQNKNLHIGTERKIIMAIFAVKTRTSTAIMLRGLFLIPLKKLFLMSQELRVLLKRMLK
jgi:hypothetical protein